MSASVRARAEKLLGAIEKHYGVGKPPKKVGDDPLDYAVWGAVATNAPADAGERGYRALQREFVDWNELRVATWREIGAILEKARVPDPGRKAVSVRRALQQMYSRLNKLTLEPVLEMDAEDARRYVEGFSDWSSASAGALYYGFGGGSGVAPTMAVCRVAERAGLMKKGLSARKQSDTMGRMVPRAKHFRFHHALSGLADVICIHKDPRCEECPAVDVCDTGRAWKAEQAATDTPTDTAPAKSGGKRKKAAKKSKTPTRRK